MDIIEKKIEHNIINDTDDNTTNTHIFQSLLKKGPSFSKPSLSKPSFSKPSCGLIVIDNFYNNPLETRNYILTQEFSVKGNFPGQRTISYATDLIKDIIQKYIEPFGNKITEFPILKDKTDFKTNDLEEDIYNGSFQYTTSRDRSWIHTDKWNNWSGILDAGRAFIIRNRILYGATCESECNNQDEGAKISQNGN